MTEQSVYILIFILALVFLIISFLNIRGKVKENNRLSPLAGLALAFILAAIVFGEERWLGYSLIGISVILSFIDIFLKIRKKQ